MDKIGIIGAMEEEVNQLKEKMTGVKIKSKASMDFYSGRLEDREVVIVRSGIGKVNGAVCTQILVDEFNINIVINTGIAGSLKSEINIGDMVIATDTLQHDVDATGFGYKYGVIPRMKTSVFVADTKLLKKAQSICSQVNPDISVFLGRIVSGDQFIDDKDKKSWIAGQFAGYCTEMEGAAIAQTAYLNKIPFLIIRSISDKADDSAHMDYGKFETAAIAHTVKFITALVKEL